MFLFSDRKILPVFAGMVLQMLQRCTPPRDSPRIRGDGPYKHMIVFRYMIFSPYSRGWSLTLKTTEWDGLILPVFAGMVPRRRSATPGKPYFPRIRGDGPTSCPTQPPTTVFSPYSRGWSSITPTKRRGDHIFPVFAGMVPRRRVCRRAERYFPRIRGDGPWFVRCVGWRRTFSPYSRGWSRVRLLKWAPRRILPVFAGMIPAQIALSSALMVILPHYDPD